jgi:hypothetical protein
LVRVELVDAGALERRAQVWVKMLGKIAELAVRRREMTPGEHLCLIRGMG